MKKVKAFFINQLTPKQIHFIKQLLTHSHLLSSLKGGRTMILTDHEEEQRQILAAEMFITMPSTSIKEWLNAQEDKEYKADMRNRFNQLRTYKVLNETTFKQEQYT